MLESHQAPGSNLQRRPRQTDPPADLGRVRAVINALPEAVFVTDDDGRLRLTNHAADLLFIGKPVHDRTDLLSRFETITSDGLDHRRDARIDSGHPVTVRSRHRPNRWFALRAIALDAETASDGTVPTPATDDAGRASGEGQTVFVLRDVTDSRDLQPEREAFLSVLSHELRTPITTIYAGSSVLARRLALAPPASQILARDISAEAARLFDLVEDLLVLARLERQVLDPLDEPVLVHRAVDSTVRMALDRAPGAPIERIGPGRAPAVHGDATYVEQACRNLILTSLRFAGPGPDRSLEVELRVDRAADEVAVVVRDRGPALGEAELERAFELPDPSAVGRLAGAGIGLFVCRHLVEAMGGRAWAGNRDGGRGGVEFGFCLKIDERG